MNKLMQRAQASFAVVKDWADAKVATVVTLGVIGAQAHAQEADPFTAAVTEVGSKVQTYGAALVGLAAAGVVFMIGVKYVKKIRGAA